MASTWVLKFPQVDLPKQPFLVHVTQKKGLDLDLLATDGEVAYRGKVRERNLAKLKASNYSGSDEDWASILRYALVSKQDSGTSEKERDSLEVQCSVIGKGTKAVLSITFRTRIEDITSRLGAVELAFSDDTDDIDVFAWTTLVIDQRDELSTLAAQAKSSHDTMQKTIETLQQELKELLQAKAEHEKQMLSRFAVLLNEKKEKIRNQQRILSTAKIDAQKLDTLRLTIDGDSKQAISNSKKRKGKSAKAQHDSDGESDGFDAMDVDKAPVTRQAEAESDEDSQVTATASEGEEDAEAESPTVPVEKPVSTFASSKAHSPPPPPRSLPFQRKGEKEKAKAKNGSRPTDMAATKSNEVGDDEETASEEDEL